MCVCVCACVCVCVCVCVCFIFIFIFYTKVHYIPEYVREVVAGPGCSADLKGVGDNCHHGQLASGNQHLIFTIMSCRNGNTQGYVFSAHCTVLVPQPVQLLSAFTIM